MSLTTREIIDDIEGSIHSCDAMLDDALSPNQYGALCGFLRDLVYRLKADVGVETSNPTHMVGYDWTPKNPETSQRSNA
jgi:hypothetical protein